MKTWILEHGWSLISGPLVGLLVYFVHEKLQLAITWLDKQSPTVKRLIAFGLSAILTPLAAAVGAQLPSECISAMGEAIDASSCLTAIASASWLGIALGGGVAILTHKLIHIKDDKGQS